jgi:hypothetical protein
LAVARDRYRSPRCREAPEQAGLCSGQGALSALTNPKALSFSPLFFHSSSILPWKSRRPVFVMAGTFAAIEIGTEVFIARHGSPPQSMASASWPALQPGLRWRVHRDRAVAACCICLLTNQNLLARSFSGR